MSAQKVDALKERIAALEALVEALKSPSTGLTQGVGLSQEEMDLIPIGLYHSTPDGRLLQVNQALIEMMGFPSRQAALQFSTLDGYAQPDERQCWQAVMDEQDVVTDYESRWKRYDGEVIWVRETARAIRDAEGRLVMYSGAVEDITRRKESEAHLAESEARFRLFMENLPANAYIKDGDLRLVYANPALLEFVGRSEQEWLGTTSASILDDASANREEEIEREVLAKQKVIKADREVNLRNGETRYERFIRFPLTGTKGEKLVGAIFLDFTAQQLAERWLEESEARFQSFMDNLPANAYIKDDTLRYIYTNQPRLALQDLTIDQILGKRPTEIFTPEIAEEIERYDRMVLDGEESVLRVGQVRTVSGENWWVNDLKFPLTGPDGERFVGGISVDITKQKEAENELRESQRQLGNLMGNLPGMVFRCENKPEWTMHFLSEGCEELTGFHAEELMEEGADFSVNLIHPEDRQNVWDTIQAQVRDHPKYQLTYRIVTKSGATKWVWEQGQLVVDSGQEFLEGLMIDITERVRAQDALKESEARLIEAQRIARIGDFVWEPVSGRVHWSRGLRELIGYGAEDVIASIRVNFIHVHPEDKIAARDWLFSNIRRGAEVLPPFEYRAVRTDGEVIEVRTYARVIRDGAEIKVLAIVQEIGEEKEAQRKLQERNEFIETILDNLPIGLAVNYIDQGTASYMNKEFEKTYGHPRGVLTDIPKFFESVYPNPSYRAEVEARIMTDIESGDPARMVWEGFEITRQDGEKRLVTAKNIPLVEQNLMISTVQDITERAAAEDLLRYQALLLANVSDAVISTDLDFRITTWNKAAERIYGWREEEVAGKLYPEVLKPDYAPLTRDEVVAIYEQNEEWSGEAIHTTKDGRKLNILTAVRATTDPEGNWIGNNTVNKDISEQKQTETALRQSEEMFRSVVKNTPIGVLFYRLKGDDLILEQVNDSACRLLGIDSRLLVGRRIEAAFPMLEAAGIPQRYREIMKTGRMIYLEEFTYNDGAIKGTFEVSAFRTTPDLLAVMFIEISEKKNARQRLRDLAQKVITTQEDERQRISRELHDESGQSLTALKIDLELLLADMPEEMKSAKAQLAASVALTDSILENLRSLAHGLRPPALDAVGLVVTLREMCTDFKDRTGLDIQFKHDVIPKQPDISEITLYRFLQESLTNIVRHADAKQVKIDLRQAGDKIALKIQDDGQGFKVESDLVEGTNRRGMGLVGMRERLELAGGRLEIESAPGKGTTLTGFLPLRPDPEREEEG
jgi:PAS domain S-box-containing protein